MYMRLLAGFIGAFVGAIVGVVSLAFIAFKIFGGGDLGSYLMVAYYGWIGLAIGAVVGIVLALFILRYLRRDDLGITAQRKKTILIVSLVIGLPTLVAGMLWIPQQPDNPPPDKELLENFQRHQATFNELAQMAQVDKGLNRVGDNWTSPGDPQKIGVSPTRINEYRRLLNDAGVPGGFQSAIEANEVEFYYWFTGSAISDDTEKGYAYLTKPPAHLLKSLDQCQLDGDSGSESYRHIQGNWYLFYDYIPG